MLMFEAKWETTKQDMNQHAKTSLARGRLQGWHLKIQIWLMELGDEISIGHRVMRSVYVV